jgi:hypothetical protein
VILTFGHICEITTKGERLHFWALGYAAVENGHLGARVLRERWEFLTAADLAALPELAPIVAEIKQREQGPF